jgi:hypothetical protein
MADVRAAWEAATSERQATLERQKATLREALLDTLTGCNMNGIKLLGHDSAADALKETE